MFDQLAEFVAFRMNRLEKKHKIIQEQIIIINYLSNHCTLSVHLWFVWSVHHPRRYWSCRFSDYIDFHAELLDLSSTNKAEPVIYYHYKTADEMAN